MRVELLMINQRVKDVLDEQSVVCSLNIHVGGLEIIKMTLKRKDAGSYLPPVDDLTPQQRPKRMDSLSNPPL